MVKKISFSLFLQYMTFISSDDLCKPLYYFLLDFHAIIIIITIIIEVSWGFFLHGMLVSSKTRTAVQTF